MIEARPEKAETRSKKIEDELQLAKTEVGKWLDAKDNLIQRLRRQLAQQQETMQQHAEQVEELEEYVKSQEEYCVEQLVEKETLLTQLNEKYAQEQEEWAFTKSNLEQRCANLEAVSEQRRLDLLVSLKHDCCRWKVQPMHRSLIYGRHWQKHSSG